MHGLDLIDRAPRSYNTKYGAQNKESYDKRYKGEKEDRHHSVAFIPFFHPAQFKWYNTIRKNQFRRCTPGFRKGHSEHSECHELCTEYRRTTWLSSFYSPPSSTAEALEINGCFLRRAQRLRRITSIPAFSVYRMHVGRSPLSSLPAVFWPE